MLYSYGRMVSYGNSCTALVVFLLFYLRPGIVSWCEEHHGVEVLGAEVDLLDAVGKVAKVFDEHLLHQVEVIYHQMLGHACMVADHLLVFVP